MNDAPVWIVCIRWRVPLEPNEYIHKVQVQTWTDAEARRTARADWLASVPEPRLWLYSTCERETDQLSLF